MNRNNQIRDQIEKNKKELKRLEQQEKLRQEKEKANISKALSIISSSSAQYAEVTFWINDSSELHFLID